MRRLPMCAADGLAVSLTVEQVVLAGANPAWIGAAAAAAAAWTACRGLARLPSLADSSSLSVLNGSISSSVSA